MTFAYKLKDNFVRWLFLRNQEESKHTSMMNFFIEGDMSLNVSLGKSNTFGVFFPELISR